MSNSQSSRRFRTSLGVIGAIVIMAAGGMSLIQGQSMHVRVGGVVMLLFTVGFGGMALVAAMHFRRPVRFVATPILGGLSLVGVAISFLDIPDAEALARVWLGIGLIVFGGWQGYLICRFVPAQSRLARKIPHAVDSDNSEPQS